MPFTGIVLLAWIPICAGLFALLSPVRAAAAAYLVGWLFLPVATIDIRGFWDLDKVLATNLGVVAGVMLFSPAAVFRFRPTGADALLGLFAALAFASSISNGLGVKDAVSALGHLVMYYGVPFIVGRIFCNTPLALAQAARLVVVGAACYTALAVFEWRMSPQVHHYLYGFFQHSWVQHVRWGFYRPIVCFPHALGLGMFLAWAGVLAIDLSQARALFGSEGKSRFLVGVIALGVLVTMSYGPWLLFLAGLAALVAWRIPSRRWIILLPVLFCTYWTVGRYSGFVDGAWMAETIGKLSEERASSLQYRIDAEEILLERAKQRPLLGWSGWGRSREDDHGNVLRTAADGLWVIFVGLYGIIGVLAFFSWWCAPIWMSWRAGGALEQVPAVRGCVIAVGMQAVNLLYNGFLSPVLTLLAGGVVAVLLDQEQRVRSRAASLSVAASVRVGSRA